MEVKEGAGEKQWGGQSLGICAERKSVSKMKATRATGLDVDFTSKGRMERGAYGISKGVDEDGHNRHL